MFDFARGSRLAIIALHVLVQLLALLYTAHRYVVLWRWWRRSRAPRPALPAPAEWPVVTVQLPVYNERRVIERLIDAVAALDYPAARLEIQVLDDSDDETSGLAAAAAARQRRRGVDIRILRRQGREGFKAGALQAGLARARGELIAVFDADFLPPRDFLRRLAPHFSDPTIGMVQARWGHLNRERSLMTTAQATMLDAHFLLEHAVRMGAGLFFNFNGSAGIWRRACIDSSGGWSSDTLTEDLDLSYRAQLRGWRFAYDASVVVPAELPADVAALTSQQRRWAKGAVQTARKLLPRVMAGAFPTRVKWEAFIHLTSNFAYPLLLALCALLPLVLAGVLRAPLPLAAALGSAVILLGVVPVSLFLFAGGIAGGAGVRRAARDTTAALVVGAGLSVNNSRAVLEGLGRRIGDWERTPKSGDGMASPVRPVYRPSTKSAGRTELLFATYLAACATIAWSGSRPHAIPLLVPLIAGFGYVGWCSMARRRTGSSIS
jgi:cellulose synthase/poly-beta-1,6-N-acetylglucosamine synthase-like glycosyltransferase